MQDFTMTRDVAWELSRHLNRLFDDERHSNFIDTVTLRTGDPSGRDNKPTDEITVGVTIVDQHLIGADGNDGDADE